MPLQLTYISTATKAVTFADCPAILETSRRNNQAVGITGMLMFDGVRFLQALEGDALAIRATVDRIRGDQRHRSVIVLSEREIAAPEFGTWSMAFERGGASNNATSLVEAVDALVEDLASANLKALFKSFARVDRQAA